MIFERSLTKLMGRIFYANLSWSRTQAKFC